MLKKLLIGFLFLTAPATAFAAPVSWDFSAGTNILQPLISGATALIKGDRYQATSTTASSTLPWLDTVRLSISSITAGDCVQASTGGYLVGTGSPCNSGGGGSGVATTSLLVIYPVTVTKTAASITYGLAFGTTTSNTWAGTQTFTNTLASNATTTGAAYFTGITASRPLYVDSTGKLGSAGSGTSGNCVQWGANNTLGDAGAACGSGGGGSGSVSTSSQETAGQAAIWGTTNGFPAKLYSVATSTPTLGTGLAYSGTLGSFTGGTGGALTISTSSLYSGTIGQVGYFDGTNSLIGTSTLYIDTTGNVGIGTTTPFGQLSIDTTNVGTNPFLVAGNTSGTAISAYNAATPSLNVGTDTPLAGRMASIVGPTYIEDSTANAFSVGATGTTSLAFNVDQSAGVGTGLEITTNTPGSGVTLDTLSANNNEALVIQSKGTSNVTVNTTNASGNVVLQVNGASNASRLSIFQVGYNLIHGTSVTAVTPRFSYTSAADVTLTASTEAPEVYWNLGTIRSHASGAIATQRDYRITGSTHTYTAGTSVANATIASSTTLSIDGPPKQGTVLGGYTNAIGLYIGAGTAAYTASTTNAIGLVVDAPTGATNNYAASTTGKIVHTNLGTGAGNGSLCQSTTGEVLYDSGANCIVSSQRFKTNIQPLGSSTVLDEINALQPVSFRYKQGTGDNGAATWVGFIAEQVAKVDTRFVQYDADKKPYSVYYQNMVALAISGIQQLSHRQDEQQKEIDALKAEVASLKGGQTMCVYNYP